jgi:hypothetical protein
MARRLLPATLLFTLVFGAPALSPAHTGRALDADGCHADHRSGTYHCHRGAAAGYTFPNRDAMLEAVRTNTFPEKTVDTDSFFSRLWPWGKEYEQSEDADAPAASAQPESTPKKSELEEKLKVLDGLYEMGLITKEEHEARRKALLGQS